MLDAVISRLKEQVPELRSVDGAAALEALRRQNAFPQITPAAFVIPIGLSGRAVQSEMAGAFVQGLEETLGVVLIIRNDNPASEAVLGRLRDFVMDVTQALAGWAPDDSSAGFRLARGAMVPAGPGTVVYQLDMTTSNDLRIFA